MAANSESVVYDENTVIGNRELMERLDRDIRAGQLSHAYILDGRQGSGRHTIARHICAAIACENRPGRVVSYVEDADQMGFFDFDEPPPPREIPADAPLPCWTCPACRKVLEEKCPDIHLIGRDGKASIGVDAVRFLRQDVLIPPNDLDTKIYIIEDAECMTAQAQNALLLTLEEPPSYVLFLLLCNGAESLLETIRSRAPVLHTECIDESLMRHHLLKTSSAAARLQERTPDEFEAVLLSANGCIGQAITLLDAKARKPILKQRDITTAFLDVCLSRRPSDVLSAISQFGTKREEVLAALRALQLAIRDLLLLKKSETVRLLFFVDREDTLNLSDRFSMQALLTLQNATEQAIAGLERNGNVRITLTRMCMSASIL